MGIKCWHKYEGVMIEVRGEQLQRRNREIFFSPHMHSMYFYKREIYAEYMPCRFTEIVSVHPFFVLVRREYSTLSHH